MFVELADAFAGRITASSVQILYILHSHFSHRRSISFRTVSMAIVVVALCFPNFDQADGSSRPRSFKMMSLLKSSKLLLVFLHSSLLRYWRLVISCPDNALCLSSCSSHWLPFTSNDAAKCHFNATVASSDKTSALCSAEHSNPFCCQTAISSTSISHVTGW